MTDTAHGASIPEFYNETRQPKLYITCGVFMVLSTVAVALRFVSRRLVRIKWHREDTLMLLSWMCFIAYAIITIADVRFGGVGLHQASVVRNDPNTLQFWAKYLLALVYLYLLCVVLPKLAIISMYLSIFGSCRLFQIICYITGAIVIANFFAVAGAGFAICIPLNYLWDKSIDGYCFDINAWFRWARLVNVLSDGVLLILPIPYILRLQMAIRLKLGLLFTFFIGGLGLVATILTITAVSNTDAVDDNTWTGAEIMFWSIVETGTYVVAPCLVSYKPLARLLWRTVRRENPVPYWGDQKAYVGFDTRLKAKRHSQDDMVDLGDVERADSSTWKTTSLGSEVTEREFTLK